MKFGKVGTSAGSMIPVMQRSIEFQLKRHTGRAR